VQWEILSLCEPASSTPSQHEELLASHSLKSSTIEAIKNNEVLSLLIPMQSGSRQPPWKMSNMHYSVFTDPVLWIRLGSEPDFLDQSDSNGDNRFASSSGSSLFDTFSKVLASLNFKVV
jgi:hypothetical protein